MSCCSFGLALVVLLAAYVDLLLAHALTAFLHMWVAFASMARHMSDGFTCADPGCPWHMNFQNTSSLSFATAVCL